MPVPSAISDLSQTASSNSPAGSESPTTADDYFRAHASFIARLRDGAGYTAEAAVASAATADIGAAASLYVQITGTTTITSFGTNYNGPRFIRFAGALTLTHNASTLILPGGANITTAAGDTAVVVPQSAGWRVVSYERAASLPMVGNGPAFSAYANATQSITSSTETKVAINTENFDTANCFDTSTNRFAPTVAGYYQIDGVVRGTAAPGSLWYAAIYKNGSRYSTGDQINTTSANFTQHCSVSDLVHLNGSTDYIELYGFINGTSPSFNFNSASITSRLSGFLVRAA